MSEKNNRRNKFPAGFLFGSATSAHQIEGHLNNDWARWEKTFGKIADNSNSATSADSWRRWRDDIKALKESGQNAYRFSIEWSRIEPENGFFDQKAISHYRDIIDALRINKITPVVTLFHFTCPLWIDNLGGVAGRKFAGYFARFAGRMAREFGDQVELWTVLNEPTVYVNSGYFIGNWYPGKKGAYLTGLSALRNLISAHRRSYASMKAENPAIKIGIAHNMSAFLPLRKNFADRAMARLSQWFVNEFFLNRIRKQLDFLGVNHYLTHHIQCRFPLVVDEVGEEREFWWPVRPYGIYEVLIQAAKYKLPIYVTENGFGDHGEADHLRIKYLTEIFEQLSRALKAGVDLRGYFYWSLLDNFEWASGYSIRFGLYDKSRREKNSAQFYKKLIKKHQSF